MPSSATPVQIMDRRARRWSLIGQRVFGLLGYEDLNDHDQLRHDPVFAVLAGKLVARRRNCAPAHTPVAIRTQGIVALPK